MLDHSKVHRNLESKLKVFGLEALDLLLVLVVAAVMSLFFGNTVTGLIFVFWIPLVMLFFLYFLKRNRPDGYLQGIIRYYLLPGSFRALAVPESEIKLKQTIIKDSL